MIRLAASAAAIASAALVSGCGAPAHPTLVVFGAASLQKAFTEIGERFTAENPGVTVEFTFAGSADLLTQLTHGAPADVLATADTRTMDQAVQAGLAAGTPVPFAANTLTIVVAPGNPKQIASFEDLARPGLALVVCAPQVPCGQATRAVEEATGVALDPVSEESAVSDVLTKVTTGQADAGIVYVTDARAAAGRVTAVAFPAAAAAVNTYPIAALRESRNPDQARKFVELVTGAAGRKVLTAAGFTQP